jgi:predicted esterase
MHPFPTRAPARTVLAAAAAALVLAACGDSDPPARGELQASGVVATLTTAQIDASTAASGAQPLTGTAKCAVTLRKIIHSTSAPNGTLGHTASAALLVPTEGPGCAGPFPIVSYNRGTEVLKARTMANPADGETGLLTAFFAAQGYVVVATDYLGYAESNFAFHPYLHAASQASTTVDAIRAARTVLSSLGTPLSGRLFVTGYSQGGHAAMATHRAIEADASLGLTVTASGPMSGPYDLSASFVNGLAALPAGTAGSPVFTAFAVTGFQKVYGNLYASPGELFKAPYATGIETLLPGTVGFTELFTTGRLPVLLGDLLTPKAVADVTNTASGLRRALDDNTLLGWRPRAPVLLCAGSRDPVVAFANTVTSATSITSLGGTVTAVDVEQVPAFAPALPPANATAEQLANYHGGVVPPLCLKVVRDNLFAALR